MCYSLVRAATAASYHQDAVVLPQRYPHRCTTRYHHIRHSCSRPSSREQNHTTSKTPGALCVEPENSVLQSSYAYTVYRTVTPLVQPCKNFHAQLLAASKIHGEAISPKQIPPIFIRCERTLHKTPGDFTWGFAMSFCVCFIGFLDSDFMTQDYSPSYARLNNGSLII